MIDKNYCCSSYLALRYIHKNDIEFKENLKHVNIPNIENDKLEYVENVFEIDKHIENVFKELKNQKIGILLSGGMDSAILASYMQGYDAYTFRWNNNFQNEEIKRAEIYAKKFNLRLHYVDITWESMNKNLELIMTNKSSPVHSIEPQIYQGAIQAKNDGITCMIVGESADLIFGGMDQLLSKDWTKDEFKKKYTFVDPQKVLKNPFNMDYVFEQYNENLKFNFLSFMDDVFSIESSSSYYNAFQCANMEYIDPYSKMRMQNSLELDRVRNGESKYLIRELFKLKYGFDAPNKNPMPRAVDYYFKDWEGPIRKEFIENLNMTQFTGNQKWLIYCLEKFLNMIEGT